MVGASQSISLKDLIDLSDLQKLLDSFSGLTGIATAILNPIGEILAASGWQSICTEYHRKNRLTALRCLESDTILAGELPEGERYSVYRCRNGLVDVAAPIFIENMHAGNIFIGQFFFEPPDIEFFTRQAEEFGFDKDPYLESLAKVPVLSTGQLNHAIDFLNNITTIVGSTGMVRKRLFELTNHLEQRVREQTAEITYSNERLRALSEASFEGIIISENGVIIEANNRLSDILGFRQGPELVGMKVTDIIAPEERSVVANKVSSGYDRPYETLAIAKDGTVFPIAVHGRTFSFLGRQVRATAIRDITAEKKAENEIQTLRDILPICSFCKRVRDDKGFWEQVETYFSKRSETDFSHSVCPECMKEHYPREGGRISRKKDGA